MEVYCFYGNSISDTCKGESGKALSLLVVCHRVSQRASRSWEAVAMVQSGGGGQSLEVHYTGKGDSLIRHQYWPVYSLYNELLLHTGCC